MENLLEIEFVNRDGDSMRGPLTLAGDPGVDLHAATKRYVDTILANLAAQVVRLDGTVPMTGPLTLPGGPPAGARDATTRDYVLNQVAAGVAGLASILYVDGQDALLTAAIAAGDALRVPLDGSVPMTGPLTLPGAPVNNLHAATKLYVDTLVVPGTLDTYDAVVAAAGGDYTDLVTACATEAAGARIFVKSGTYNETANVVLKDGQMLIGANPENTIVDFGAANRKITNPGGCTNQAVKGLTVQGSIADYMIELQGDHARVENCRIIGTAAAFEGVYLNGDYGIIKDCYFTGFTKVGVYYAAKALNRGLIVNNFFSNNRRAILLNSNCQAIGNYAELVTDVQMLMEASSSAIGNFFRGTKLIWISGDDILFASNWVLGAANQGIAWDGGHDHAVITGNYFDNFGVICNQAGTQFVTITGNHFNQGDGVVVAGDHFTITGNTFLSAAHVELKATSSNCVTSGNNLVGATGADKIDDSGDGNHAEGNAGVAATEEKIFFDMKNTSGFGRVAGEVVVIKAVAPGNEIDTTVNVGDDMVLGMVEEVIGNGSRGLVQTKGKTEKLKVNGTVNIGIGDFISTMNVAGIGRKAVAGHTVFAIALEAYAGADSNGVIDALLITPRKI